jgi:hypothetical protein
MPDEATRAEVTTFKEHPVIALVYKDANGVERRFSFGKKKAKLILAHVDDIRVFVETAE